MSRELGSRLFELEGVGKAELGRDFLYQSVSKLGLREPRCVSETDTVRDVVLGLKNEKTGCVLVLDGDGKVSGIFSERDYIIKVYESEGGSNLPISTFMTSNPVCESPTVSVAFALNLMSQGGFRHLPLVDDERYPVGILSVKDIVDYISSKLVADLEILPTS